MEMLHHNYIIIIIIIIISSKLSTNIFWVWGTINSRKLSRHQINTIRSQPYQLVIVNVLTSPTDCKCTVDISIIQTIVHSIR